MDSGLEERILPSIRRSQILLIYRNGGVDNPETCGQIACAARLSEGWRPAVRSRARRGRRHDQRQPGDLRSDRVHGRETGTIGRRFRQQDRNGGDV